MSILSDVVCEDVERRGLRAYVEAFWPFAEPGASYSDNWHVHALSGFVECVYTDRSILRGCISMPPRMGKSLIVSVLGQAFTWTKHPEHTFMSASYDLGLVRRDAEKILQVVNSPLHQACYPQVRFDGVQALMNLQTSAGGRRTGTTPKARGGTGWGANTQDINDPLKVSDSNSDKALKLVESWFRQTMANRIDGLPENFARLVTMQRLHLLDLVGVCKELGYELLSLPIGERDTKGKFVSSIWAEAWPVEQIQKMADEMTPSAVNAQLMMTPDPDRGEFVQREWVGLFGPSELPAGGQYVQAWDLGFDGSKSSHSQVGAVLALIQGEHVWVIDAVSAFWDYPETKAEMVRRMHAQPVWRDAATVLVEKAANGFAALAELGRDRVNFQRLVPVTTGGKSKEERLKVQSDKVQMGRLHVAAHLTELVDQLVKFPNAPKNDLVDCVVMLLQRASAPGLIQKKAALEALLKNGK